MVLTYTSFLSYSDILLSTLFPKTLNQCFCLRTEDTHTKQINLRFVLFSLYVFRWQTRKQKILNWMAADTPRIQSAFNFFVNTISICYCRSTNMWTVREMLSCCTLLRIVLVGDRIGRSSFFHPFGGRSSYESVVPSLEGCPIPWEAGACGGSRG
jgi:hypothetical protein